MTGTDWAALADRLDDLAKDRRWDCWTMHGDGSLDVPEGHDPSPDCCDAAEGADSLRAAAVGLRRLAQLDAAIGDRQQLQAWLDEHNSIKLRQVIAAVLGSGEQPEGTEP